MPSSDESLRAPHQVLPDYYMAEVDRPAYIRNIFNRTAPDYDRVERMMAFGSGPWYRHRALRDAGLSEGMSVLDIGTGTGLVACEAASIVCDAALVTGVDPSAGMIGNARVPDGLRLLAGSAECIPAADAQADFLSMGYALRHISDLSVAFREFYRVLKPGGQMCLLEITQPEGAMRRFALKFYLRRLVPLISRFIAKHNATPELMRYYWDTIEACATPVTIMGSLELAGFVEVRRHVELGVLSEYRARKPL